MALDIINVFILLAECEDRDGVSICSRIDAMFLDLIDYAFNKPTIVYLY